MDIRKVTGAEVEKLTKLNKKDGVVEEKATQSSGLSKIETSKILNRAQAAALAAAILAGATSCTEEYEFKPTVENKNEVIQDNAALIAFLDNWFQKMYDRMDKGFNDINDNLSDNNKSVLAAIYEVTEAVNKNTTTVADGIARIESLLLQIDTSINVNGVTIGDAVLNLKTALENGDITAQEYYEKLLGLVSNINALAEFSAEKLTEGVDLLKQSEEARAQQFVSIMEVLKNIDTNTQSLPEQAEILAAFLEAYQSNQPVNVELMESLIAAVNVLSSEEANRDKTFEDLLKIVIQQNYEGNQSVVDVVNDVLAQLKGMGGNIADIGTLIKDFMAQESASDKDQLEVGKAVLAAIKVFANDEANRDKDITTVLKEISKSASLSSEYEYSQTQIMAKLEALIKDLGANMNQITVEDLDALLAKYETDLGPTNDLISDLAEKLDAIGKNTKNLPDVNNLLGDLIAKYEAGNVSQDELLKEISAKLDNMLTTADMITIANDFFAKGKEQADLALGKLLDKIGEVKGVSQAELEQLLFKYTGKIDISNTLLQQLINTWKDQNANQASPLTYADLEKLIKEYYKDPTAQLEDIKALLAEIGIDVENIDKDQITVEDIEGAVKNNATDLSTTNELIQTVITLLANMNTTGGDTSALSAMIGELIDTYKAGNANILDVLNEISAKLDKFATLEDLQDLAETYSVKYEQGVEANVTKFLAAFADLKNSNEESLGKIATSIQANTNSLNTVGNQILAKLDDLKGSQGSGVGGAFTKADLVEVVKEYYKDPSEALANIENLLANLNLGGGSDITLEDLANALAQNKTDLSTTNELIQTLITLVANIKTANTSNLEALAESLIQKVDAGTISINNALQQLINAAG